MDSTNSENRTTNKSNDLLRDPWFWTAVILAIVIVIIILSLILYIIRKRAWVNIENFPTQ